MKGNGTIIEEKGRYRAFFMHNGKRISKRFATKKDAADWLAVNRSDVALGEWVEPTDITFGQWILEYLRRSSQRVKKATMNSYKLQAKKLAPLADIRLQRLNSIQLQKVIDNQPTSSTQLLLYKFIVGLIKKAQKMDLTKRNILLQLEPPRYRSERKEVFTKDEIKRIYKVLADNRYKALFTLAFASGCRIGEIQGLKIQCVKDGLITINNTIYQCKDNTPKSASSIRDIILPPDIIAMLRAEWQRNGAILNGYVFSNRTGSPVKTNTIQRNWQKILMLAGVPYRNFHYIRHTHATILLSQGIPVVEVQHRLGHSSASITLDRYGHILKDNEEKIINALAKIAEM